MQRKYLRQLKSGEGMGQKGKVHFTQIGKMIP